mgnify:CR=1 FL=1
MWVSFIIVLIDAYICYLARSVRLLSGGGSARRRLLFARYFDTYGTFHVNQWPELKAHPEWGA